MDKRDERKPKAAVTPSPRIGDAGRDAVLARLSNAFAGGYITQDEHGDFAARVLAARVQADLDRIVRDLNVPEPALVSTRKSLPAESYPPGSITDMTLAQVLTERRARLARFTAIGIIVLVFLAIILSHM